MMSNLSSQVLRLHKEMQTCSKMVAEQIAIKD